jgi:SAM-dependent methyltransferase
MAMSSQSPRDLQKFYDHGYHNIVHRDMMHDEHYYRTRSRAFARLYFTEADRKAAVLDYGCGLGQTVASLPNAYGYDASAEARAVAKAHGLRVFDRPEDITESAFDVVICRHALEHVPDPLAVLKKLRSFLRPQGKLILILPRERHYKTSFSPDQNMHLFAWNFRCINNLLSVAGFRVCANKTFYNLGYRKFLPLARVSFRLYELATILAGLWYRNGELVIHAMPLEGQRD